MTQSFAHHLATHPLFLLGAGIVCLVLIGLTLRSIVRRDKAMINVSMDKPQDIAAYNEHWRKSA